MKSKIIQALIICAVIAAGILAVYLQKPIQPVTTPAIQVEQPPIPTTFSLPVDAKKPVQIGILGESRGKDFHEDPINLDVLGQLLKALKIREVEAIFFTGNLVAGVDKKDPLNQPVYNQKLKDSLEQFSVLYNGIFDDKVPFYPALGDRELLIPNSGQTFIDHFKLEGAIVLGNELLYTVSIGDAMFAVIATDEIMDGQRSAEEAYSTKTLEWLEKVLRDGARKHKYLFVVGYEPAFPSTTTYSKTNMPQRDAFWKILISNKVLAYFSSKEHFFDRSYRYGVWQIITGGGGAPVNRVGGKQAFYHSLVLTIPESDDEKSAPGVQVIDDQGNIVEEFSLSTENQPLYQMRISRN